MAPDEIKANKEERKLAHEERTLQVEERERVAKREDVLTWRLDKQDESLVDMKKALTQLADSVKNSNDKLVEALSRVAGVADKASLHIGFFAKYVLPLIFAILLAFTGYLGLSARDRAETVCAAINTSRTDTVSVLQQFQPLAPKRFQPVFERAIEERKQPAC